MPPKKKVAGLIKLQIQAGAATPAPPIGPALGQHGVNIMEFCKAYNAATESQRGNVIPVEITVYEDRSFTFITKTPPAAARRAAAWPPPSRSRSTSRSATRSPWWMARSPPSTPPSPRSTSRPRRSPASSRSSVARLLSSWPSARSTRTSEHHASPHVLRRRRLRSNHNEGPDTPWHRRRRRLPA